MGLQSELLPVGGSEFPHRDNDGNLIAQGEGDSGRKPFTKRPLGTDFPTLVIEAGYSQSWASLRAKGRWWFESSDYAVKIVLLMKMDRSTAQIRIEKWKAMEQPRTRPSRAITRAMAAQVVPSVSPECVQTVDIIRAASVGDHDPRRFLPNSYRVTRGLLCLEFEDLFLRRPGPGEHDIVFGTKELQEFAVRFWRSYHQ